MMLTSFMIFPMLDDFSVAVVPITGRLDFI